MITQNHVVPGLLDCAGTKYVNVSGNGEQAGTVRIETMAAERHKKKVLEA